MTVPARIAWVLLVLVLVGGGVLVATTMSARSDAASELDRVTSTREERSAESARLSERVEDLLVTQTGEESLQATCFVALAQQTREWNRLNGDIPTIFYSASEIDPYIERARDMVDEARKIAADCAAKG